MKSKKIFKKLGLASIFIAGLLNTNKAYASLDVEPYNIPGVNSVFADSDVPSALKVTTAGDGLAKGTILYRHSYIDMDYYSPIAPSTLQGTTSDPNNGKYNNWGPWLMEANKTSRSIEVTYYYASGKLNKSSTIYTDKGNGSSTDHQSVGTLASGTPLEILGIDDGYVYFDLTKHTSLTQTKGSTKIARVSASNVTYTSSKVSTVFSGYANSALLTNFKPVGKYWTSMHSGYKGIVTGKYTNPSYAPSVVANKTGEWRYIGYNAQGETVDNPYFISDSLSFQNIGKISGYSLRYTPWNPNDAESGEYDPSYSYSRFAIGGKTFDYDTNSKYNSMKSNVISRLVSNGDLKSVSDNAKRISLRTHATKQPTLLLMQRKESVYYRTGFLPLESGLRDIYVKQIKVIDESSGSSVATWSCSTGGGCSVSTGTVEKGKRYRVETILANGANSALLKNTLESQVGYMYDASKVYTDLAYSKTKDSKILRIGNKGNMGSTKNSTSSPFIDSFYVTKSSGTIDVYSYVGGSHTGVDNLKYDNDMGAIRLTVKSSSTTTTDNCTISSDGKTKTCGSGDIVPLYIEVYSKTEGDKLVYQHNYGDSSPYIKKALIPGYEYKIVYTAVFKGSGVTEYTWSEGTQDNPSTTNVNEYVAPSWSTGKYKEYQVPMSYYIEKYSGGTRDLDSISKSGYMYHVPSGKNDLTIPMYNNSKMAFETEVSMYQYPYLNTSMNINITDSKANKDRTNDYMSTTVKDNFDISISNLKVTPSKTYVSGSSQKVNYNVTYDATLTTPSYVTISNYETTINTAININGQTFYVKDHLLKGSAYNKDITHSIEGVTVPSSGQINISVNLNYDKNSYETSNYANNVGSTTATINKVKNPSSGSPNDTVNPEDSLNSNNPNKGGDANNNCLVPRTKNTWTTTHGKVTWNSSNVTYKKISNGASVSFKKYSSSYMNASEATETYKEEFGIKQILFRSKYTKDNKYGNNGWVDLLNSNQKDLAIIQAGYGFELQVVTTYSTDAFTKRTWNVSNNGSSGTRVSGLNTAVNYGLEDIFVELPGTSSTRKILSSTGYEGTTLGLNATKKVSGNTTTWTYTVKSANSLGIKEVAKIFIPETAKDGDYNLKIYTPPVSGVGNINKKTYSALCDRKEVTIKVKGSAMDDLNSHNTQVR